jgi:hypothetical protein
MKADDVALRQIVRVTSLSSTPILAGPQHSEARQEGAVGQVIGVTREDDTALVWVKHGSVAPYWPYELALVGTPEG